MWTNIYDLVVYMIGELPMELQFIYGFGTVILFAIIIMCVICPFWLATKVFD